MIRVVDKMPEDGQFVAVWLDIGGNLFADTLRHSIAGLIIFEPDGWKPIEVGPDWYEEVGAKYLAVEE